MRLKLAVAVCLILVAVGVALLPALSQQEGPPFNGQAGQGGPGMGGPPGPPPGPPPGMGQAAMVVADGVVYVAAEGKVFAFEAKSLKKLAEVSYSTRPQRGPGGGPGGGQPPLPGIPPAQ